MTLIKKAVDKNTRKDAFLLFLAFALLILLSFTFIDTNFYLKFFTGYFAYGRSNGQLRLFLIFGGVVTGLRCLVKHNVNMKVQHLLMLLMFVYQSFSYVYFQSVTHQPLLDTSWPTAHGYTSVNAPMHIHAAKPVMYVIGSFFSLGSKLSEYDTGVPFLSFLPQRWYLLGCSIFLVVVVTQILSLCTDKNISLLKMICNFSLLKLSLDGGVFNATGIVIVFVSLLIYGGWRHTWIKVGYLLYLASTIAIWLLQENIEFEAVLNTLTFGVILRGTFFLLWAKMFFKEKTLREMKFLALALLHIVSLRSHPWIQGELFPRLSYQGKNLVGLSLPEKPWILGDSRSYELKSDESLERMDLYQSKILAFEEKKEECLHRTTSFSAVILGVKEGDFEIHAPSLSLYGRDEGDQRFLLRGYLEGCFPLTRGVQNAVLFALTTQIKDSFIYKDERIWNNPHIRSFGE